MKKGMDRYSFSHSTFSLLSVLLIASVALSGFVWVSNGNDTGDLLSGFAPAPQLSTAKFSQAFYSSLIPKASKKPVYTNIGEKLGEPFFRDYWDASSSAPAGHSAPVLQGYFLPVENSLLNKYGVKSEFSQYIKPIYRVKDVSRNKQSADYFYLNIAGKVDKTIIGYVGTDELKKLDTKNQLVELQTPKEQIEKELKEGRTPSKSLGWISKTKDFELPLVAAVKVALPKQPPSAKKIIANFVFDEAIYSSLAPIVPKNPLYSELGETANNPFLRTYWDASITHQAGHTSPTLVGYLIPQSSTYADRYLSIKKEYSQYLQPVYRVRGALRKGGKETDYIYQNKPGKVDKTLIGFVGTDELKKYDTKNQLVRLTIPSDQNLVRKGADPTTLGWIMKSKGSLDAVEGETVPIPPEVPVLLPVVPLPLPPKPTPTVTLMPISGSEVTFSFDDKVFGGPSKQGDKEVYLVKGKEYEVQVSEISDKERYVVFNINGQLLPKLKEGQTVTLPGGIVFKLISIYPIGKTPTPTPVPTKTLTPTPTPEPEISISIGDATVVKP